MISDTIKGPNDWPIDVTKVSAEVFKSLKINDPNELLVLIDSHKDLWFVVKDYCIIWHWKSDLPNKENIIAEDLKYLAEIK